MPHRLDPLLDPESIVIVGASTSGGMGSRLIKNLQHGGFKGKLFGLHPKNKEAFGVPCYPDFKSLPENIIVIPSDSGVSSYLLMTSSICGLFYGSI